VHDACCLVDVAALEAGSTNALDNLVTVCRAHHERAEHKPRFFEIARNPSATALPRN